MSFGLRMLFIDAREGLSGDTLLAAMMGMLDMKERMKIEQGLKAASQEHGIDFALMEIEESGEHGLGISYRESGPPVVRESSYDQCFSHLAEMEERIGARTPVASTILQTIFEAEGEAHQLPPREVHLHEIGRPQAILNMAAIGHLSGRLMEQTGGPFVCSTITTGRGIVVVSHGAVRIPAPVSEILLRGMKHEPGGSPGEKATPTGIAAVKCIVQSQSDEVPTKPRRSSIGFGTKRFAGRLGRTTLLWT